jgi:hypothetical protein
VSGHGRYEALLGALALGEATPADRDELTGHARACAACAADLENAPHMLAAFAAAREAETWRPAYGDAIVANLRERRLRRARYTVGALGWAAAVSIVLNATFASGLGERVLDKLRDASPAIASTAFLQPPARPGARSIALEPVSGIGRRH